MSKKSPHLPPVGPTGGDRSATAKAERRAAEAQLLREQKQRARRRAILIQIGVGALVVAVVIAVTAVVLSRKDGASASATPPPGVTSDGAIRFGPDDAPVTLQAVEDFQCPICRQFEKTNADLLTQYRDGDQVAVEYRPIAFLDRMSSTEYSSRALNASACVLAASGKDSWLSFHEELYDNQPPEQSEGLPDSDLVDLAAQAGAKGPDVKSCIEDRRYDDWVQQTTKRAFADRVTGTPTLFVNGEKLNGFDADTITAAVQAAGGS